MSKGSIFFDTSEFDTGFKRVTEKTIPDAAEKGLFNAMNELLHDSINLPPQAPKDMGDLWGSIADTISVKKEGGSIVAEGGFNIAYAHRHHEVPPGTYKYTKTKGATQPGPKYMESKMIKLKDKYQGIVADTIKKEEK